MLRKIVVVFISVLLFASVSVFAGGDQEKTSGTGNGSGELKSSEGYKIALSMSFIGNDWQAQSRNILTAMAKLHYPDKIKTVDVFVAGTDANVQNRQILQMISAGYDAIICYPVSPTALNNSIQKACDAGIVFVTYDSIVSNDCAYKVTMDQVAAGAQAAEWLAKAMDYKGDIAFVTGVPGTSVDADRNKGAKDVFAKYPDINIVAEFPGMWTAGPAEQGMAKVLASGTKIDGVWCQGGSAGIVKAFIDADVPLVPVAAESENAYRLYLMDEELKAKGLKGCSFGSPLYQGAAALHTAVKVLDGDTTVPEYIMVDYAWATQDDLVLADTGSVDEIAAGANVFPPHLVGPGFLPAIYHPEYTKGLNLNMVLTGDITEADKK